ncbi:MAG TPA: hypothetical protein VMU66_08530 [Gaiellales bacterium]|nr:hypothetical protein [Gaiellales bacterium]
MRPAELEALLDAADELVGLRERVGESDRLEAEAAHERRLIEAAAPLGVLLDAARGRIAVIARELERQWVAQAPLEAAWQRAIDLEQQALAVGAEAGPSHREAERARIAAEAARLSTRGPLERLLAERQAISEAVTAPPIALDPPAPPRRDDRPQSGRRDALELIEFAGTAAEAAARLALAADQRRAEIAARLDVLAVDESLRDRLAGIERGLPASVELSEQAPASAGLRLRRAGIEVIAAAP